MRQKVVVRKLAGLLHVVLRQHVLLATVQLLNCSVHQNHRVVFRKHLAVLNPVVRPRLGVAWAVDVVMGVAVEMGVAEEPHVIPRKTAK